MMRGTGHIELGPPGHELKLPKSWRAVKSYATYTKTSPNMRGFIPAPPFQFSLAPDPAAGPPDGLSGEGFGGFGGWTMRYRPAGLSVTEGK